VLKTNFSGFREYCSQTFQPELDLHRKVFRVYRSPPAMFRIRVESRREVVGENYAELVQDILHPVDGFPCIYIWSVENNKSSPTQSALGFGEYSPSTSTSTTASSRAKGMQNYTCMACAAVHRDSRDQLHACHILEREELVDITMEEEEVLIHNCH
jgi:hypothetical protein